jgi:hypothetical protein
MTISKMLRIVLVAGVAAFIGSQGLDRLTGGSVSIISSAQAIVGRPLTPVSVAGVARRTVRRCAVGVYYC